MTGDQSSFARFMGVNKSTVTRARRAGRLVMTPEGLVDFEASAARWHQTAGGRTDVSARHAQNRGGVIPTPHPSQKRAPAAMDSPAPADSSARMEAATDRMHFENSILKLEMALRRGLRFERTAVQREANGLGAMVRAGIERVIDQTAPRIAAATNELERRRILDKEIRRLRWVLKREIPRALRRMREAGAKVSRGGMATE
jgi:hypothetical protein